MAGTSIAEHALLSDCHSAALVTTAGLVDWLCFPRFDSPSVFAALLDEGAGRWAVHPAGEHTSTRRYVDQTLVLETTFHTPTGTVSLTDALAMGPDNRGHGLGTGAPHLMIRSLTCVEGEVEVEVDYQPRPEYGIVRPLLSPTEGGVTARGGAEWLVLSTPVALELSDSTASGSVRMRAGQRLDFALHRATLEEQPARTWTQGEIARRLDATVQAWKSWSELHQNYQGPWRHLVHHSGRVLQGLTFQPSGAIVAAAITSLPEGACGERNWGLPVLVGTRRQLHHAGAVGGAAPTGLDYLVLGHESLGMVEDVGEAVVEFAPGDYVVSRVRRAEGGSLYDAIDAPDLTTDDEYFEHGISRVHGFLTEHYVEEPRYLIKIPPGLRHVAVLLEPLSRTAGRCGPAPRR